MQAAGAEAVAHGDDGFLDKIGGAVTKGFEVREDVDVGDVGGTNSAHRLVQLLANAAWLPSGKRLAVEFGLGVEVFISLERLGHHQGGVGGVGAEHHWWLFAQAGGFHPVFDTGKNHFSHPTGLRILILQGLTEARHQAHVGELAHKGGD